METHEPEGDYLAIHSVCVSPRHRKRGIAKNLLEEYVERVKRFREVRGIRLIAKQGLVGMYERSGFASRGKSQVVHGQDPWYELGIDFDDEDEEKISPFQLEEDVDVASVRSPGKRLATTITTKGIVENALVRGGKNKFDLYCPRAECRCLLVKQGAANWVVKGTHDGDIDVSPPTLL
jgi:predicted GNAT family acetyltransferase